MGDSWEAEVKSVNEHLKKTLGNCCLKYEELNIFMHRVEAILNSRPLIHTSTTLADADTLTPGHFSVGGPLVSPPEPSLLDE